MAGYVFIPIPEAPRRSRARPEQMCLDRRLPGCWFGSIDVEAEALQPIHVGSGFKSLVAEDRAGRGTVRSAGRLAIPGSSWKGATRTRFEAITGSCALWVPRDGSVLSRSRPDVRHAHLTGDAKAHPVFSPCTPDQVCPACALFGFQARQDAQQGRVAFSDLLAPEGVTAELRTAPAQWAPRLHHIGEAQVVGAGGRLSFAVSTLYGRKLARPPGLNDPRNKEQTVEAIPAGTRLMGRLRLFNVTAVELGALLTALGLAPEGDILAGGIKAFGFGRLRLRVTAAALKDDLLRPRLLEQVGLRRAFEGSEERFEPGERALLQAMQGGRP